MTSAGPVTWPLGPRGSRAGRSGGWSSCRSAGSICARTARPTRPCVLLVHGYASSMHAFDRVTPLLAARRRVVRVDLLGHGCSELCGTGLRPPGPGRDAGASAAGPARRRRRRPWSVTRSGPMWPSPWPSRAPGRGGSSWSARRRTTPTLGCRAATSCCGRPPPGGGSAVSHRRPRSTGPRGSPSPRGPTRPGCSTSRTGGRSTSGPRHRACTGWCCTTGRARWPRAAWTGGWPTWAGRPW